MGKQSFLKAHTTSSWVPPLSNPQARNFSKLVSVNRTVNIVSEGWAHSSLTGQNKNKLKMENDKLKAENHKLTSSLVKSESLRRNMENI